MKSKNQTGVNSHPLGSGPEDTGHTGHPVTARVAVRCGWASWRDLTAPRLPTRP